jgi:hypothetical protein
MRSSFLILLLITLLLAGGYWYTIGTAMCNVPIAYRLGTVDDRFNLSSEAARSALSAAEAVWEEAIGYDLFIYDDNAALSINFVFDERQAVQDEEARQRQLLDEKAAQNEDITSTHAELVAEYEALAADFTTAEAAYETRLAAYNREVASYNDVGGAPPAVFAALEAEREALDEERRRINAAAARLNQLVRRINELGETGNELIAVYNENVDRYNRQFAEEREFTQGDYQRFGGQKTINIYTFADQAELVLVLAHEFGHALSIEHVAGPASLMYPLMGEQPVPLALSADDVAGFNQACGPRQSLGSWYQPFVRAFSERGILADV